jgi:protocatechuate 3,4-dioxygenase beta subunit
MTSRFIMHSDAPLRETLAGLERQRVAARRRALKQLGATLAIALPARSFAAATCSVIPSATPGPFPGDGTNGPNVLTQSGIVRSDVRASFGAAGATAATGTPLALTLQLVNVGAACAPLAGRAVYVWHCDAAGHYSLYSPGAERQNYLRGVQVTDADGRVRFATVFPGCYPGRWPHIHFEVYPSAAHAVNGDAAIRSSQLALPEAANREVYAQASLYPGSLAHLARMSLRDDFVFADGGVHQLARVTGSVAAGYAAELEVGIGRG